MEDKEIEDLKQEVEGLNKQIENIENKDKKPETSETKPSAPKEQPKEEEEEKPKEGSEDAATLNFIDFHDPKKTKQIAICKQKSYYNFATKKIGTEENIKDWDKKNQAYKKIDHIARNGNFIRVQFR